MCDLCTSGLWFSLWVYQCVSVYEQVTITLVLVLVFVCSTRYGFLQFTHSVICFLKPCCMGGSSWSRTGNLLLKVFFFFFYCISQEWSVCRGCFGLFWCLCLCVYLWGFLAWDYLFAEHLLIHKGEFSGNFNVYSHLWYIHLFVWLYWPECFWICFSAVRWHSLQNVLELPQNSYLKQTNNPNIWT